MPPPPQPGDGERARPAPAPSQDREDRATDRDAAPPTAPGTAYEVPGQRGRRTGLAAIAAVVAALLVWFAWPLLSSDDTDGEGGGTGGGTAAEDDGGGGSGALDDAQLALLEEVGAFDADDCRPPVREPLADQGVEVDVACADPGQAPTRVVFRRFGSIDQRDAALAYVGRAADDGDCSSDPRAAHAYTGAAGEGRVVCLVDSTTAGLSWSVPDQPIMGSARLDDPDRAGELYDWWAELVGRTDG